MVCDRAPPIVSDSVGLSIPSGNLALSRALGDFEFKKNYSLSPEKQIITADPDITVHEITEDDEFLVVACDGQSPQAFSNVMVTKTFI
jgi:serine/threonine protein phosphatase PrpC